MTKQKLLSAALLLCALAAPAAAQTKPGPVIFAAASMKTALDQIAEAWKTKMGETLAISYASSGTLAKQIEAGAPADLFISADTKWVDYLAGKKLLREGSREDLLGNELVLVAPADSAAKVDLTSATGLPGALANGKLAVCTVTSCPAGIYGKQALEKLGLWSSIEPKLAQADSVRGALLLVARGEAPLGIVYATDAKAEPKVKIVAAFPESSHDAIIYPVAILADSKSPDAAALEAYLSAPGSVAILKQQGFTILGKPPV